MRICGRKIPRNDRRSVDSTKDCFGRRTIVAITVTSSLIFLLDIHRCSVLAKKPTTMSPTAAVKGSLSFVVSRNGRRPFASLPWSSLSSSSSSSAIDAPIIRMGMESRSKHPNKIRLNHREKQHRIQSRLHTSSTSSSSTTESLENGISKNIQKQNELSNANRLRTDLEKYRMTQSKSLGKSPSVILPDKVIDGICALEPPPTTKEDLSKVKGLGPKKLELSGVKILSIVSSHFRAAGAEDSDSSAAELSSSVGAADNYNYNDNDNDNDNDNVNDGGIESSISASASAAEPSFDPAPSSAPLPDDAVATFNEEVTPAGFKSDASSFSLDSYVAPAPYSAPEGNTGVPALDSYVAPAPYSYAAPVPYSFNDEEEEDEEDYEEISEESFGAAPSKAKVTKGKKEDEDEEKSNSKIENKPKKISKTQLKKDLKEYRVSQMEDGKPSYTVFTNQALEGIYSSLPTTKSGLLDVKGIGPKKLELYGDDILALVAPYVGMGFKPEPDSASGDSNSNMPIQPEKIDPKTLTGEQRWAADMIFGKDQPPEDRRRRNVFVTGSAGTGKSYLLKYVVEILQGRHDDSDGSISIEKDLVVGVCAPTGVAAVIVGGSTLHSFFGIGLGTGSRSSLLAKVRKNTGAKTRIDETNVLIIDECSMLHADLLETLDMVARAVRKDGMFSDEPFGGMQVIAFGDFFQLPPVHRYDGNHDRRWRPFCFDSPVWSELGLSENIVELKEVQRQEHGDFVDLLNKVRIGSVDPRDIWDLNEKCLVGPNNPLPNDGILPTRLYVLNRDVDSENIARLQELKGNEVVCTATDVWRQSMPVGTPASVKKKMKDSLEMEMPDEIKLKVGAQVMLTRNKDTRKNLVNGSRGVVERFETNREGNPVPIVRFDSGIVTRVDPVESTRYNTDGGQGCLVRMQVPLKLAWAITIHKSQGSTLTRASLDISSAFEYGQCYVALSRVRSLEGLWLERPAELRNIMVSQQVVNFFANN